MGATSFILIERRLRVLAFEVLNLGTAIKTSFPVGYCLYGYRAKVTEAGSFVNNKSGPVRRRAYVLGWKRSNALATTGGTILLTSPPKLASSLMALERSTK